MSEDRPVFSGRGILFAVIDNREAFKDDDETTISVITEAINKAIDKGYDDAEAIARYITTSSFSHEPDKRIRYNSVLKANDTVGANILRKLYNSYNELAGEAEDPLSKAEASGFAAAIQIVISPFSCEDENDDRLVDWSVVDRLTAIFEKEQRYVRRERQGNPQ